MSKSPKNPPKKGTKKAEDAPKSPAAPASAAKAAPKSAEKAAAPSKAPFAIEHHLVNMQQVFRAARALKTHASKLHSQPGAKAQLFAADSPVTVEIMLHKVPIEGNMKRKTLPLVKPVNPKESTEICVFARDAKIAKQKLQLASAPNVKKVIDLNKLRTHYNQYEARRTLAQAYDIYICEDTILPDVCRQLGSAFLRMRKAPVAFKLNTLVSDQIKKIRDSALFSLSAGVTQSYKIGTTGFTEEELCANFASSIDAAVKLLPLGWANVKQIALIATDCAPLPIYNNLTVPSKILPDSAAGKSASAGASASKNGKEKEKEKEKAKRPAPSASDDTETTASKKKAVSENGQATPKKVEGTKAEAAEKKVATPKAAAASPKVAAASKSESTPSKSASSTSKAESATPKAAGASTSSKSSAATPKAAATMSKASATPKSATKASKPAAEEKESPAAKEKTTTPKKEETVAERRTPRGAKAAPAEKAETKKESPAATKKTPTKKSEPEKAETPVTKSASAKKSAPSKAAASPAPASASPKAPKSATPNKKK